MMWIPLFWMLMYSMVIAIINHYNPDFSFDVGMVLFIGLMAVSHSVIYAAGIITEQIKEIALFEVEVSEEEEKDG